MNSKLYLSGIEIQDPDFGVGTLLLSKLYLSGIEILWYANHIFRLVSPNCTLVELKYNETPYLE